jgi:hypothetical protein
VLLYQDFKNSTARVSKALCLHGLNAGPNSLSSRAEMQRRCRRAHQPAQCAIP